MYTERGIEHWIARTPARARLRVWVAASGGDIVGVADARMRWELSRGDVAVVWVGVLDADRGRGIGGRLYAAAEAHVRAHGARRIECDVDAASDEAMRFARARGFSPTRADRHWILDPRAVDLAGFAALADAREREGFELVPLREARHLERELHALYAEAELDAPADLPDDNIGFDDWLGEVFSYPDLDDEGSFVVLHDGRPVSLAWLVADREGGVAVHDMTGTLREYRRRGLARLAKLATIRWAAESGITKLLTSNDSANSDMLALNEHLGYRSDRTVVRMVRGR